MYRVFIEMDAARLLRSMRRPDREAVIRFLDHLSENPSQPGDFQESDDTGRSIEVKRLGNYWLWYWADHPVKEIKVVAVQRRKRAKA